MRKSFSTLACRMPTVTFSSVERDLGSAAIEIAFNNDCIANLVESCHSLDCIHRCLHHILLALGRISLTNTRFDACFCGKRDQFNFNVDFTADDCLRILDPRYHTSTHRSYDAPRRLASLVAGL